MATVQTRCLEGPAKVEGPTIESENHNRIKGGVSSTTTTTRTSKATKITPYHVSPRSSSLPPGLRQLSHALHVVWGFTESDFATFVIPDMAFGMLGALASTQLIKNSGSLSVPAMLLRMPAVLAYNWANLVIFDLANQRGADSVAEDRINKPWRPIPRGLISMEQTRKAMLVAVPLALALNWYLGVWTQGILIHVVTWLYNDLRGGDEFLVREALIAVGYAMFNSGSLKVAGCGLDRNSSGCDLNGRGVAWTAIISAVILTTMQVQDLKDVEGDRLRGRKTMVLHAGERFSRYSIATCVLSWSVVCAYFWGAGLASSSAVVALAGLIAWRVVRERNQRADRKTWKLWCLWLVLLYMLPVVGVFDLRVLTSCYRLIAGEGSVFVSL